MTMKLNVALIAHDRMKDQMVNFCYAYEPVSYTHLLFIS